MREGMSNRVAPFIFGILVLLASPSINEGATITVGSSGKYYTSISNAVKNAVNGDIIRIETDVLTECGILVNRTNLIIEGLGPTATNTIVQGHADYGMATSRVFNVVAGASNVMFRNLTIRHGNMTGMGAGIQTVVETVVSNCVITLNKANGLVASTGNGGGIRATTNLTVYCSTISDNYASGNGAGVYIAGYNGQFNVYDSTFSGNVCQTNGGAIYYNENNSGPSKMTLVNSTIYRNTATYAAGGGLLLSLNPGGNHAYLYNCTIYSNAASLGNGGGLWTGGNAGAHVYIYSSVLAGNIAGIGPDFYKSTANTYFESNNLVGVTNGSPVGILNYFKGPLAGSQTNANGSYVGTNGVPIDPKLMPLADNGGPTKTCALQEDSLAIDHGRNPYSLPCDQRGRGYSRFLGTQTDIGAYEFGVTVNQAPLVEAGINQTIMLAMNANLDATVTDEGLPDGVILSQWSVVSGPGPVIFGNSNLVDTTASFVTNGTYVLRLVGDDTALSATDTVTIAVVINQAPVVDAGTNQTVMLPDAACLDGTVTDDGWPLGITTKQWSVVSGPGTVIFGNSNLVDTTASFSTNGTYVLRLWVSDTLLSASDTVSIVVIPHVNQAPTVEAGGARTITLPAGATLDGTVADDGWPLGITNVQWSQVSGPGTVTFGNSNLVDTTASFPTNGTYVLRLWVSDTELSASDTVIITVCENQRILSEIPVADLTRQKGLCLYLGEPKLGSLAWLAGSSPLSVQGVVSDREVAQSLRGQVVTNAMADRVSVVWRRTAHLPYLDNLVNLIVAVGWGQGDIQGLPLAEVVRVLAPGGVAVVGSYTNLDGAALLAEARAINLVQADPVAYEGAWIRIVKTMNPAYDEWSHYKANAGQTMVSKDTAVGPGTELRWVTGASWSEGGHRNDIVAGGRTYHEEREWVNSNLTQRYMVARDAFNGHELWRAKIGGNSYSSLKSADLSLCADDNCVYYSDTNGLLARNGATGVLVTNYGTVHWGTVTSHKEWLITSSGAIRKDNGVCVVPLVLDPYKAHHVAEGGVVYTLKKDVVNGDGVQAFRLADGTNLWKTAITELTNISAKAAVKLMVKGETIYVASGLNVFALDRTNGVMRWSSTAPLNAAGAPEAAVFPLDGQVCLSYKATTNAGDDHWLQQVFLNADTGQAIQTNHSDSGVGARCWPMRATDRYLITLDGAFIDHGTMDFLGSLKGSVRPACGIGRSIAYGLDYYGPHACDCYVALRGSAALSSGSVMSNGTVSPQLIQGVASAGGAAAGTNDWPLYRGNMGRTAFYAGELPEKLVKLWSVKLGSAPVPQATGAGELLFVADPAKNRVMAFSVDTGHEQWSFPTEGRVSVAPTYYKGLCLFGDHAGWVYCLEALNGKLVWQRQVAREQKVMSAYDGFESAWPVKSGVMVFREPAHACFVAGRCGSLEGGLDFYDVEPFSGQVQRITNINVRIPTDIVVGDGRSAIIPNMSYTPAVVTNEVLPPLQKRIQPGHYILGYYGTVSILYTLDSLDPEQARTRKRGLIRAGDNGGDGDLMAFDSNRVVTTWGSRVQKGPDDVICRGPGLYTDEPLWTKSDTGQQMHSLLLTGQRVYCAGIPWDRTSKDSPALWVLSNADGAQLQKISLDGIPTIDGISAVGGRLFVTTVDGQVIAYGAPQYSGTLIRLY